MLTNHYSLLLYYAWMRIIVFYLYFRNYFESISPWKSFFIIINK